MRVLEDKHGSSCYHHHAAVLMLQMLRRATAHSLLLCSNVLHLANPIVQLQALALKKRSAACWHALICHTVSVLS